MREDGGTSNAQQLPAMRTRKRARSRVETMLAEAIAAANVEVMDSGVTETTNAAIGNASVAGSLF